jgi:pimeloyl-ACP methyl ester carboxylesterase
VDPITAPRVEGTVTLATGRKLGVAEFGPADGRALVWMHGTPGARRQIPEAARLAAAELGVRIVGIDRPGVGASDAFLYDSLLDSARDIEEIADRLGIDHFAMVGMSGGGPYVLAAAYAMPGRVTVAGVLGGITPMQGDDAPPDHGLMGRFAGLAPLTAALRVPVSLALTGGVWLLRPLASPAFDLFARVSPEGDRRVFARPEVKAMFLDDLLLGSRSGLAAPIYDFVLMSKSWGFSVRDVRVPVRWWHGDADHMVPLDSARHVVSLMPDTELFVRPGESHLGGLGAAEEVLTTLLDVWDSRSARRA